MCLPITSSAWLRSSAHQSYRGDCGLLIVAGGHDLARQSPLDSFFPISGTIFVVTVLAIIWAVAGLNILGIRENARFTFLIFIAAAFVILNLIVSGIIHVDFFSLGQMKRPCMIPSNT